MEENSKNLYDDLLSRYKMGQMVKSSIGDDVQADYRLLSIFKSDGDLLLQVRFVEKGEKQSVEMYILGRMMSKDVDDSVDTLLYETADLVAQITDNYKNCFRDAELSYNWLGD